MILFQRLVLIQKTLIKKISFLIRETKHLSYVLVRNTIYLTKKITIKKSDFSTPKINIQRIAENPIIYPDMDERMGNNINGPSLIRVPEWIDNPLGRYYLYFAHHKGTYIRLAYANNLEGPWKIYTPGVLDLKDSYFNHHIASPDVHVMHDRREIWMYYHGCCIPKHPRQVTRIAVSVDGLNFEPKQEILGASYWRMFEWKGYYYILEKPGKFKRSKTGISDFEEGPNLSLYMPSMRHPAVQVVGDLLYVFYSRIGGSPEHILLSTIELTPDWTQWIASEPISILKPEMDYEGVDCPIAPSRIAGVYEPVRQLRDPAIFAEDGKTYLLYAIAGEQGIAIAQIH